jgi:phenylacetic acid degradation operon negative regulatory protein
VKPTAKRIVLELMSVAEPHEASTASLIPACALLGVAENSVRVALARLVAAGTLEIAGRGHYRLGAPARAMTRQVTSWRDAERSVRKWDGSWAGVHLGALSRTDRAALRRRDRALRLLGFRALARDLAVRPDNLAGGVGALRDRLYALGVEDTAPVFRADELDAATDARARSLWAADRLTESYGETCARIERWLIAVGDLEPRAAAREAFFFGGDVLRKIVFDPRLPEPLVDVAARRAMVDAAKRLDATGRKLWARLYGMPHGLVITPDTEHPHDHPDVQ